MRRLAVLAILVSLTACGGESDQPPRVSDADAQAAWLDELATTGFRPPDPDALWSAVKSVCEQGDFDFYVTLSRGGELSLNQERVGIKNACPDRLDDWDAAITKLGEINDRVDYICGEPLEALSPADQEEALAVCDQYEDFD